MGGHVWQEKFYPALADRWPTAFQRVGVEPWVIHGPCLLRPELCQATPRLTRYGDTRFTRGTASGRGGPGPQGSRINPVYPYEMPTGSPEVSSFAKLTGSGNRNLSEISPKHRIADLRA